MHSYPIHYLELIMSNDCQLLFKCFRKYGKNLFVSYFQNLSKKYSTDREIIRIWFTRKFESKNLNDFLHIFRDI